MATAEETRPVMRYVNARNHALVFQGEYHGTPIITVENYEKWYSLFLVDAEGVHEIEYDGSITWHDHVPNPSDVQAYADRHGYLVDETSYEVMVGRFYQEVYESDYEAHGALLSRRQMPDTDRQHLENMAKANVERFSRR